MARTLLRQGPVYQSNTDMRGLSGCGSGDLTIYTLLHGSAGFMSLLQPTWRRRRRDEALPLTGRVPFSYKLQRLGQRMKDPEWRKYGLTLVAGKMLALVLLFSAIFVVKQLITYGVASADDATPTTAPAAAAPTAAPAATHGHARRLSRYHQESHDQSAQHRLDARRGVPRVRHAGRLHHA